jgi:hypothetical protein
VLRCEPTRRSTGHTQQPIRRRAKQPYGIAPDLIEPHQPVLLLQNYWHASHASSAISAFGVAVMMVKLRVTVASGHRELSHRPAKANGLIVLGCNGIRLLATLDHLPLVDGIGGTRQRRRDSASRNMRSLAAVSERALMAAVPCWEPSSSRAAGPPLQQIEVALTGLGMAPDHCCVLCRCDVPGRRQVRQWIPRAEMRAMASAGRKLA